MATAASAAMLSAARASPRPRCSRSVATFSICAVAPSEYSVVIDASTPFSRRHEAARGRHGAPEQRSRAERPGARRPRRPPQRSSRDRRRVDRGAASAASSRAPGRGAGARSRRPAQRHVDVALHEPAARAHRVGEPCARLLALDEGAPVQQPAVELLERRDERVGVDLGVDVQRVEDLGARQAAAWNSASPSGWTIGLLAAARRWRRSKASARARSAASVVVAVVVLVLAGAADHDLVLLDRDRHGPVAGPVLGVDGVVGHGRVEPQPVALLAVVEGALEVARAGRRGGGRGRRGARGGAAWPRRRPRRPRRRPRRPARAARPPRPRALGLLGRAARLLLARGLGGLELGGDQRVVLGAQIDLVVEVERRARRRARRRAAGRSAA